MAAVQLRGKLRLLEISQLPDIAARKLVPSSRQLPHIVVWKCMEALGSPLPDTNSPPYLEYAGILWNHMEYHKWIPLDVGCNFLMVPSTPTTRSLSSLPFQMSWQIVTGLFHLNLWSFRSFFGVAPTAHPYLHHMPILFGQVSFWSPSTILFSQWPSYTYFVVGFYPMFNFHLIRLNFKAFEIFEWRPHVHLPGSWGSRRSTSNRGAPIWGWFWPMVIVGTVLGLGLT